MLKQESQFFGSPENCRGALAQYSSLHIFSPLVEVGANKTWPDLAAFFPRISSPVRLLLSSSSSFFEGGVPFVFHSPGKQAALFSFCWGPFFRPSILEVAAGSRLGVVDKAAFLRAFPSLKVVAGRLLGAMDRSKTGAAGGGEVVGFGGGWRGLVRKVGRGWRGRGWEGLERRGLGGFVGRVVGAGSQDADALWLWKEALKLLEASNAGRKTQTYTWLHHESLSFNQRVNKLEVSVAKPAEVCCLLFVAPQGSLPSGNPVFVWYLPYNRGLHISLGGFKHHLCDPCKLSFPWQG